MKNTLKNIALAAISLAAVAPSPTVAMQHKDQPVKTQKVNKDAVAMPTKKRGIKIVQEAGGF